VRDALEAAAARAPWLTVHRAVPVDEPGWHLADALTADPAALRAVVEDAAEALLPWSPTATSEVRLAVAAGLLLNDWSRAVAVLVAGGLAATGRVPDLGPGAVWLRWSAGRLDAAALTSSGFACAAGDPAAGAPGARVVGDLRGEVRRQLASHLPALHAALRAGRPPLLRVGSRTTWGSAGDGLATALGPEDPLLAELLAGAPAVWGRQGPRAVEDAAGRPHVLRPRTSCCLWYRLPGADACLTCPRTSPSERRTRLADPP
jgi:hypothetical protein